MKLQALHILLTYECNYECDHCFVWGSSRQSGTLTLEKLFEIVDQAKVVPGCEWIYFEGGEPFLYYAVLGRGVERAKRQGFKVGIVSNGYWATSEADALEWLSPFETSVDSIEISSDAYHGADGTTERAGWATAAAEKCGIAASVISIAQPDLALDSGVVGHLPEGESKVMYRGRAARRLSDPRSERPWLEFTRCPHEDLREPERLHVDPFGNLHVCQGIVIGNLFERPLDEIRGSYDPESHPVIGPIISGGPAELARKPGVVTRKGYADACHLCYETRVQLRSKHAGLLGPDQMYAED